MFRIESSLKGLGEMVRSPTETHVVTPNVKVIETSVPGVDTIRGFVYRRKVRLGGEMVR